MPYLYGIYNATVEYGVSVVLSSRERQVDMGVRKCAQACLSDWLSNINIYGKEHVLGLQHANTCGTFSSTRRRN